MTISRDTVFTFEDNVKEQAEILLQLNTLFSTPVGSVALDRSFGIDMTAIDLPVPVAQAKISAEVITKIARYIPEIAAKEVLFQVDAVQGDLRMEVIVGYV